MAFSVAQSMPWHSGEETMHRLTHVPPLDNPNSPFLTPRAASQIQRYPLMAVGTLETPRDSHSFDSDNGPRPWCTLWGGETPLAQPVGPSVIGVRAIVDGRYDPVVREIFGDAADGEVLREGQNGKAPRMIAAVAISLEERNRVKLFGRMVAGARSAISPEDDQESGDESGGRKMSKVSQVQLAIRIEQSLGNCPKYLNSKTIHPAIPDPVLISNPSTSTLTADSPILSPEALSLLSTADTFFVASADHDRDMDVNHRGGPPGFVRVEANGPPTSSSSTYTNEGAVLIWPEYSGNNLYQTLGNLQATPRAGLVFPDFASGNVLYLTGNTEVLIGKEAAAVLPHSNLAVRLRVTRARFVKEGLPFRGRPTEGGGASPYNPRVRYLAGEKKDEFDVGMQAEMKARMVKKEKLTPTINRYRFTVDDPRMAGKVDWKPGQYVALSFSDELDMGYSHMRDDEPTSLNDDWLRTFTVSNTVEEGKKEFEITVRNVGAVTGWLAKQNERIAIDIGVLGFGGDFVLKMAEGQDKLTPFVAAGIGITPLLGQLGILDLKRFRLLWTIGVQDVGLVWDVLKKSPELASVTTLFLTGDVKGLRKGEETKLEEVQKSGATCEMRRMKAEDLTQINDKVEDWFLCTAPTLRKVVQEWLPGKKIVYENFNY